MFWQAFSDVTGPLFNPIMTHTEAIIESFRKQKEQATLLWG
jgi:hypothetical protein